jgi:uncharacterized membrane protein
MLKTLKEQNRLTETVVLALMSFLCLSLSVFRILYSDTITFLFLNWNLFLAFIPWLFSTLLIIYPRFHSRRLIIILLLFFWLLFFPNAPYILTDLFHLHVFSSMPVWFDLVLILAFAWTGLMFGFLSLWNIEKILSTYFSARIVPVISILLLFIGSFGIYVGRYLRWNSWDIIREPLSLLYDIGGSIISPSHHHTTWGVTLFMGIFLNMVYWSLRLIRQRIS